MLTAWHLCRTRRCFYDLRKLLEESSAQVPPQLAHHEASRTKPGGLEKRRDQVVFAKT